MKRSAASAVFAACTIALAAFACSAPTTPNLSDQFGSGTTGNTNGNSDTSSGDDDSGTTTSMPTGTTSGSDAAVSTPIDAAVPSDPVITTMTTTADAAPAGPSCPYTGTPLNVSAYPTCLAGGVCVPMGMVPAAEQASFATCPTGLCLPSKVVAALGNYLPPTCTALEGAEGRCLSTVIPSISAQKAQLQQSTCDTNELCAPCFSPLDGTDTGACETVKCDMPKDPPVTFAACCSIGGKPQGKCVPKSLAGSEASSLFSCDSQNVCAPTENLGATFVPKHCSSDGGDFGFFTGGYDGVCLSLCIKNPDDGSFTDQGNCDNLHWCAPCNDPFSGDPTGAPGCN